MSSLRSESSSAECVGHNTTSLLRGSVQSAQWEVWGVREDSVNQTDSNERVSDEGSIFSLSGCVSHALSAKWRDARLF